MSCGRCSGLVLSAFLFRSSIPGSNPSQGHCIVSLALETLFSHSASLHPGVHYKWQLATLLLLPGVTLWWTTTSDKTVETFQYNFQFRAMVPLCSKETNSPPSPPLVQCCFGLAAQAYISCVTANNIAIGEGGNSLLICDSKHFCQGECKKIGILVMCINRFCLRL